MSKLHVFTAISLFLASSIAHAATQGTLGATSTGIKNISITVPKKVKLTNIADWTLASTDVESAAPEDNDTVCVYSNSFSAFGGSADNYYNLTATSLNGIGAVFNLKNATTNVVVPYKVKWSPSIVASYAAGTQVLSNATATTNNFTGADARSSSCATGGADNATISITILQTDVQKTPGHATPYTDTLTIVVSPV